MYQCGFFCVVWFYQFGDIIGMNGIVEWCDGGFIYFCKVFCQIVQCNNGFIYVVFCY